VVAFLLRRSLELLLTLGVLVLVVFLVLRLAPGGPAQVLLGPDRYTPALEDRVNHVLGLDRSLPEQVVRWIRAVIEGELGISYFHRRPASQVVLERLGATLLLGGLAFALSLAVGVSVGVLAAARQGSRLDRLLSHGAVAVIATPSFWLGIGLILLCSVWLGILPSAGLAPIGREGDLGARLRHLILPVVTMAASHAASLALYTRSAVLEVLTSDFVRTARAMGASTRRVLWRHTLRAAAVPIITVAGLTLAHFLEGSIVVETVFGWPGIGQLTTASVARRDYPVLLVISLWAGIVVVTANLMADLLTRWMDPRTVEE
jgi:peptide/nickel transport system permease protein